MGRDRPPYQAPHGGGKARRNNVDAPPAYLIAMTRYLMSRGCRAVRLKILCVLSLFIFLALGTRILSARDIKPAREYSAKRVVVPPYLRPGDKVRVVAPSSWVTQDALNQALEDIRALGFVPVYREDIVSEHLDFAGTHERREREFLDALHDPEARAIWAVRGGYGATFLLPHLDAAEIRKARKWLIGFSDITVLHAAWARAGVASLHGPIGTFLARWRPEAVRETVEYLSGQSQHSLYGTPYQGKGHVSGVAVGGNLALLTSLVGTHFMPDWHGGVLVIEDVEEAPYRLERYLLQLQQAGMFAGVQAVLVGQFTDCDGSVNPGPAPMPARERVLNFLAEHFDGPVIADVPVGHDSDSRPILLGAPVDVNADSGVILVNSR